MFKFTTLAAVLATLQLMDVSNTAHAAPGMPLRQAFADHHPAIRLVRNAPSRTRALKLSTTQSAGPCGVWRCTWPTGNGGCLVWEKTRCKVINPF